MKIKLGDRVKCRYTGFTGIAIAKTEFINGCIQYDVAPSVDNDGKLPECVGVDEQNLDIIERQPFKKKAVKKKKKKSTFTGGPTTVAKKMRGY